MALFSIFKTIAGSAVKKPSTLAFPLEPKPVFDRTRGRVENNISACVFCGMCQRKCPTGAIEVTRSEGRWSIERLRCIQCNACVDVCPTKCLSMAHELPDAAFVDSSKTVLTGTPPQPKKAAAAAPNKAAEPKAAAEPEEAAEPKEAV